MPAQSVDPHYPKTELASSGSSVIVVKHSAKTARASNGSMVKGDASLSNDESIADALVISLGVICLMNSRTTVRKLSSPNGIIPSKQDCLMPRTNRSA
jgi:hypothetical protein